MRQKRSLNHWKILLFRRTNHLQSIKTNLREQKQQETQSEVQEIRVYFHQTKEWWIYLARKDHRRCYRYCHWEIKVSTSWCTQFTIWQMKNLPHQCKCGKAFSTDHAMTFPHGGLLIARHDEVRYITVLWLTEICTGEEEGVWWKDKGSRICCIHSMGRGTTFAYKRLAELLAQKRRTEYGITLAWMRCTLSFPLIRWAVMAVRASRSASNRNPDANWATVKDA